MNVLYPLASPTEARKNHDVGFRRVVVPAYPRLCAQGKRRRLKRCLEALPDLGPALAVLLLHVEELCKNLGKSQHEKKRENRNHVHSKNHVIHHVDQGEFVLRNSPKIYCTRSVPWQVHDLALLAAELSQQVWVESTPCSERSGGLHASAGHHTTRHSIRIQGRNEPSSRNRAQKLRKEKQ